ncbi:MAG TPA: hypothetical protein VJY37_00285, partial [Anaerovoracaceae bacterium]|nr:hypothetical protein [Anaerovoracaceae bacterium]
DYIMASLGVLSKKYRNAAIKLLEKSLDFKFPEKKDDKPQTIFIDELNRVTDEQKKRDEEYKKHIEECEAAGYDMSAYKAEQPVGGASKEEVEAAKAEALRAADAAAAAEKAAMAAGQGLQGKWAQSAQETQGVRGVQDMGDCSHECEHCTRPHCPNRKK